MSIGEWLNRLGCIQYYEIFKKKNVNRLIDLKLVDEGFLLEQAVKIIHETRIMVNY